MIRINDAMLYAAFQEVDTRLQNLLEGEYETELRSQPGNDGMEFAQHCNDLAASYNHMLEYFLEHPFYAKSVKNMEPVTRIFVHG